MLILPGPLKLESLDILDDLLADRDVEKQFKNLKCFNIDFIKDFS